MALVHEFERTGNWLFKRRSWLPVILLITGLIVMYLGNRQAILFNLRDELIFLGVSLFGLLVRILTIGFTPMNTSGRNTTDGQVADKLNTTGIYSVVRHPLYLGNFCMWLGPVLFMKSVSFTIIFCLIYWVYYERIMFAEEQFLRRKFGEAYDKWSETVAAFIPLTFRFKTPSLSFSFRNILKREYHGFVNIFIIFFILDLFRNYLLLGKISPTKLWLWLVISSVLIWVLLRILHKMTKVLHIEGR